jgi:hypothetical protein
MQTLVINITGGEMKKRKVKTMTKDTLTAILTGLFVAFLAITAYWAMKQVVGAEEFRTQPVYEEHVNPEPTGCHLGDSIPLDECDPEVLDPESVEKQTAQEKPKYQAQPVISNDGVK